jgi:caffeoyl-CoA O-methyltransferase
LDDVMLTVMSAGASADVVSEYLSAHSTPADDVLRDLAAETVQRFPGAAGMQVGHDEAALITMLVRLVGARNAVGVDDRIDLRIGPALDTLRALAPDPVIDFAFVDADKVEYPDYYAELVPRLRPGGLLVLDNVLMGGRVLDPDHAGEHAQVVRRLNDTIVADERVESVMLPVRDGVTLARRVG